MTDALSLAISEASFEGVVFPVQMTDTDGGHDGKRNKSLGRKGADIQALGQKEYSGTMIVPLLNGLGNYGTLFPDRYYDLIRAFEATPIGTLVHPTKGQFTAFIETWSEKADPGVRNGVVLTVKWWEHNGEAGLLLSDQGSTPLDSPATATSQASTADSTAGAGTGAQPFGYVPVAPLLAAALSFLETTTRTPNEIQAQIASLVTTISTNITLPSLAATTFHATVAALESLRATVYRLRDRYLPNFVGFTTYVTPRVMSVPQIAQTVYGDAALGGLILAANALPDPLFVRQGTVLTILPASQ